MSAQSQRWQWVARAGYAARGFVFIVLSAFTATAAFSPGARPLDTQDALGTLLRKPFGSVLLIAIAAGLMCFALWRGLQCFGDADHCGGDIRGIWRRGVYGFAALFYVGFAGAALAMVAGFRHGNGDDAARDWTAWLLTFAWGRTITMAIGAAIVASAIGIAVSGLRAQFRHNLKLAERPRLFVSALGSLGYLTRALLFAIIGTFLIFAAIDANAHEAAGLSRAMLVIRGQSYGGALLGLTAAGLLAFGAYGMAEALFRRVDVSCVEARPSWLQA